MKTGPTDNKERPAAPGLRHRWVFLGMGRNSKYGPRDGWVFLGMGRNSKYGCKNAGAALIETPAHTCRFAQPYSSRVCSPAEPSYASGCGAKVLISSQTTKPFPGFLVIQDKKAGKEKGRKCCTSGKKSVTLPRPCDLFSEKQTNRRGGYAEGINQTASRNVKVFRRRQVFQDKRSTDDKVFSTMQTLLTSNSV